MNKKKKVSVFCSFRSLYIDRIMVLCDGKITGIVDADKVTKEELGLMMAGIVDEVSI